MKDNRLILPAPLRLLIALVCLDMVVFAAMRLVFLRVFYVPNDPFPPCALWEALYIGTKFDLRLALLINLPVYMVAGVQRIGIFGRGRRAWSIWLVLAHLVALMGYVFDFGHYAYLEERLNVTALRFLYNPLISAQMIWETYPVVTATFGVAAFMWGFSWLLMRIVRGIKSETAMALKVRVAVYALSAVLIAGGLFGKFAHYPLRWSDAFFSPHPFSSALALNPVVYFFDTMTKSLSPFDIEKAREAYPFIAEFLGVDAPDADALDYRRTVSGKDMSDVSDAPNVVIVLVESFAHYKIGAFGNPLSPTPNFDDLASKSLLFDRFYVPSPGTARSVFTLITGLPDLESDETSSRNPLIVRQPTIINAFKGYSKYYFLGGSVNWANIRGLLAHNIPGLKIYEEGSYSSPRVDVWGISDLSLFDEADKVLSKADKPFFAIIQTSGNHRPYTIPEDNRGFKTVDITDDEALRYGFISAQEFNSFRFMDHSIGQFMEMARREGYFSNTVFVFLGDHGLPGHAEHIRPSEDKLALTRFHVPLAIYAPGMEPRRVADVASEVDVMATLAAFTNTPYVNTAMGRNLLDKGHDGSRYAFTVVNQSTMPEIGVISADRVFMMNADGSKKRLHDYGSEDPRENIIEREPQVAAEMEKACRAIYETSRYMPYSSARYFDGAGKGAAEQGKSLH